MNVVEIVTFPCSEAFIVDRAKVLGPAPEASMKSPGCLQTYHALQVEKENDKHVGCIAAVWETHEAHKALMAMPDYKESVQKAFGPAVAGAPDIRHIQHLVGDFNAPFAAPVTEIATFKLKEGTTLDGLREQIGVLGGELSAASHAIAWGDCVEHPDTLVALLGWPSIDAHRAAAKGEQAGEIVGGLMAQAHISIKHYSFAKYTA